MPENENINWFEENNKRVEKARDLLRRIQSGEGAPIGDLLNELREQQEANAEERGKPTKIDKEQFYEALAQKYGPLSKKELFEKELGEQLRRIQESVEEANQPSFMDLSHAVAMGEIEKVKELIAAGIDVNGKCGSGHTLLMSAIIQKRPEIIDILLNAGAKPGLLEAAALGETETVRRLLDEGVNVDFADYSGNTALRWAVLYRHLETAAFLIERQADVNHRNKFGQTALFQAAVWGDASLIDPLLQAGANVGFTEAAMLGDTDTLLRMLDEGADIHAEDPAGLTALMAATACGQIDCVQMLLERGADAAHQNAHGQSALTWAVAKSRLDLMNLLIDQVIDLNAQRKTGSAYARGRTILMTAVESRNPEAVRLLLERGADVNIRNERGNSALDSALRVASIKEARGLEFVKILLEAGADANTISSIGRTPLAEAAYAGSKEIAALLLDYGADVNLPSNQGWTPLMWAAMEDHFPMVKLLVEAGADVNAKDENGRTVLNRAYGRSEEMMRFLVERGATYDKKDVWIESVVTGKDLEDILAERKEEEE
jgi:ankyrin repeat protein